VGSPSPGKDSALKGLGNMSFIRSVIQHHKDGGNAEELEKEYNKIQEMGNDYNFTQSGDLNDSDATSTPLKEVFDEKKDNVQAENKSTAAQKVSDVDSHRKAFSSKSTWEDFSPTNHPTREMKHSRQQQSSSAKNPYNAQQNKGRKTKQVQSTILPANQTTLLGGAKVNNATANLMAAPAPKLTAAQKARIAENKKRAMMIRQQKLAAKSHR